MTLNEIQNRFSNALIYLSNGGAQFSRTIPDEVLSLAQQFQQNPRLPAAQIRPEDLVTSFLNLLIIASEIGIDLEEKTQEVIAALENPAFFSA
jgi:hypothetical protein